MAPRALSKTVSVSPQITLPDMAALSATGVERIISNRPDGEEADQPTAAAVESAAREAGMDFAWVPVSGRPEATQVSAIAALLNDGKRTVMFCRSGMRSAACWAMAQRLSGADADDLRATAAAAGYDLSGLPL